MNTPTYEELVAIPKNHSVNNVGKWQQLVSDLKPGDVCEIARSESVRTAIRRAAKGMGVPIRIRESNGRAYLIHLKPEDVK